MNNISITTSSDKAPSIQDGQITLSETMTISQAINDLASLSRQSLHINLEVEKLTAVRTDCKKDIDKLYDLVFQISTNLERMEEVSRQLDEMSLVEHPQTVPLPPAEKPAPDVLTSESFRIAALSKALIVWLTDARPTGQNAPADMDVGDGLELAHMVLASSQAIQKAVNGV